MTQVVLPEDRAWRRTFLAGILGLCLGFVVPAVTGAYLVVRFIVPPSPWRA